MTSPEHPLIGDYTIELWEEFPSYSEEVKEVVDLNLFQLFNIFPADRNPLQLLSTFLRDILSAE